MLPQVLKWEGVMLVHFEQATSLTKVVGGRPKTDCLRKSSCTAQQGQYKSAP